MLNNRPINILTWNIHKTKTDLLRDTVLPEIVEENKIDIIVLQEANFEVIQQLKFNYEQIKYEKEPQGGVRIFVKKNEFEIDPENMYRGFGNKLFLVHLKRKGEDFSWNIAAVHLYSKIENNNDRRQLIENKPIFEKIREFEQQTKHKKTIIIGDFNQNPHEGDLTYFDWLGAENCRNLLSLKGGHVHERFEDYWYNPMWNFLGDVGKNNAIKPVTGTYFCYSHAKTNPWQLFDGMIVRPCFKNCIDFCESFIVTSTDSIKFVKSVMEKVKKKPTDKKATHLTLINEICSDHLPVKFTLNFNFYEPDECEETIERSSDYLELDKLFNKFFYEPNEREETIVSNSQR